MGKIEQAPDIRGLIAIAHNNVIIAKAQLAGADNHTPELIELARLIANHPQGVEVAKDLAGKK